MCYMIAVGKNASADGSVMVARNCDAAPTDAVRVISVPRKMHEPGTTLTIPESDERPDDPNWKHQQVSIPQVPETYAYTAIARVVDGEPIEMAMGGINEFQVSAGASTGGFVNEKVASLTGWPETVLGDFVTTLVLQRCKTAREGIRLLGELTEKYGGRTDNYIVADPNEAWLFEQYHGYHWAAARVPDDCFVVEANIFRLAEINPDDPDNYLCDPDLIPFAVKHGLWDPASGQPFHASRAYGTTDDSLSRGGLHLPDFHHSLPRIWRGCMLLAPSAGLKLDEPTREYPLFLRPDRKITPQDILAVLKDHYEGTELDEYGPQDADYSTVVNVKTGRYRLAPTWAMKRFIGCPNTVTSWVSQSRGWLPDEIGGVLWGGLAAAATSPHIPWYACNRRMPKAYQIGKWGEDAEYLPDSAYWLFETTGNLMNLFYQATVDMVRGRWEKFDADSFDRQGAVEAAALELHRRSPAFAAEFLTSYSNARAQEALDLGQQMLHDLFTVIARRNTPIRNLRSDMGPH